jgi:hypothetical protein
MEPLTGIPSSSRRGGPSRQRRRGFIVKLLLRVSRSRPTRSRKRHVLVVVLIILLVVVTPSSQTSLWVVRVITPPTGSYPGVLPAVRGRGLLRRCACVTGVHAGGRPLHAHRDRVVQAVVADVRTLAGLGQVPANRVTMIVEVLVGAARWPSGRPHAAELQSRVWSLLCQAGVRHPLARRWHPRGLLPLFMAVLEWI